MTLDWRIREPGPALAALPAGGIGDRVEVMIGSQAATRQLLLTPRAC